MVRPGQRRLSTMGHMTRILAADTMTRPASAVLERRFADDWTESAVDTAALDALALEQARIGVRIAGLVARMDGDTAALDLLTSEIAELLAQAEEIRIARAWAAARRAGDEARWAEYLDLD